MLRFDNNIVERFNIEAELTYILKDFFKRISYKHNAQRLAKENIKLVFKDLPNFSKNLSSSYILQHFISKDYTNKMCDKLFSDYILNRDLDIELKIQYFKILLQKLSEFYTTFNNAIKIILMYAKTTEFDRGKLNFKINKPYDYDQSASQSLIQIYKDNNLDLYNLSDTFKLIQFKYKEYYNFHIEYLDSLNRYQEFINQNSAYVNAGSKYSKDTLEKLHLLIKKCLDIDLIHREIENLDNIDFLKKELHKYVGIDLLTDELISLFDEKENKRDREERYLITNIDLFNNNLVKKVELLKKDYSNKVYIRPEKTYLEYVNNNTKHGFTKYIISLLNEKDIDKSILLVTYYLLDLKFNKYNFIQKLFKSHEKILKRGLRHKVVLLFEQFNYKTKDSFIFNEAKKILNTDTIYYIDYNEKIVERENKLMFTILDLLNK